MFKKLSKGLMIRLAQISVCFLLVIYFVFTPVYYIYAAETVSISATVGGVVTPPTGGGGGGTIIIPTTAVRFSGYAYPGSSVYLLKEGKEETKVVADNQGAFSITLPEAYDTTTLYTLYAVDLASNKSLILNYPIVVYSGYVTHLSGIRFAPTIVADKSDVNFADSIFISGYSVPNANLEVVVSKKESSQEKKIFNVTADADGAYKISIPVLGFAKGEYLLYIKYKDEIKWSKTIAFNVGDISKFNVTKENIPGDCNFDSVINLVDFSVLAFWYKKPNPPICVDTNKDRVINLIDFSIMAFYWNG